MDGTTSLLLLVGCGALILRPHDIPIMARAMGRAVGATVRSLRLAKNAAEEVMAENVKSANDPNSELGMVRRGLRDSLSKFDSVTAAVRKDMADVPFSPRMWIQKGVTSLNQTAQGEHQHKHEKRHSESAARRPEQPAEQSLNHTREKIPIPRKSVHAVGRTNSSSGVDFIARAIEEAALAEQQKRVFAGPFQRTDQPNLDKSERDDT